jgi:hypothetical protein
MIMLGCKPEGRFTEQHDIFFGVGNSLKELIPSMKRFWKEAKGRIHIDAWREVTAVEGFRIEITSKSELSENHKQLFFVNLGGYKENEFEEFHYKVLSVAENLSEATKTAKATQFYKHCGFKGATSHIDDKFGIDVDDIYNVNDILLLDISAQFQLKITASLEKLVEDQLHIGYLKLEKVI